MRGLTHRSVVPARATTAVAAACCLIIAVSTPAEAQLRADLVAGSLTQPLGFVQDPSDATVQVVVQQDGRVRVLKSGILQAEDYLDLRGSVLSAGEAGLLGFAFAPDYGSSGRVFVSFINLDGNKVIARFTRGGPGALRADPASRFDLRWPDGRRELSQPGHYGGHIAFGPDGRLYVGMGDSGQNDPLHAAQNPLSLLGKLLRLDVSVSASDPEGYDVPADNPFVGQSGVLGELWSVGLRNPWRWSFDDPGRGGTGALVIGDVGERDWEEINYQPAGRGGRNYGWRNREGAHGHDASLPAFSTPLIDPVFEYARAGGSSITGGFVYRGTALGAAYRGRYFFADFIQSRVWSIQLSVNATTGEATAADLVDHTAELGAGATNIASFGTDAGGELYLVAYGGTVYRIAAVTVGTPPGGTPPKTSERGRRTVGVPIGRAVPRRPVIPIGQRPSDIGHLASDIGHLASDIDHRMSDISAIRPALVVALRTALASTLAMRVFTSTPDEWRIEADTDGDGVTDVIMTKTEEGVLHVWICDSR